MTQDNTDHVCAPSPAVLVHDRYARAKVDLGFLARRMGYEAPSGQKAGAALLADVERHRERTLALFERLFVESA